jgi:predicted phosphoribosyltransferase
LDTPAAKTGRRQNGTGSRKSSERCLDRIDCAWLRWERAKAAERGEIERRRKRYVSDRARAALRGCLVIIVDDGIAASATTLAAIRAVRAAQPSELVLAVPVAPPDTRLRPEVNALVCPEMPRLFGAIVYEDFG